MWLTLSTGRRIDRLMHLLSLRTCPEGGSDGGKCIAAPSNLQITGVACAPGTKSFQHGKYTFDITWWWSTEHDFVGDIVLGGRLNYLVFRRFSPRDFSSIKLERASVGRFW
ncbi:unnamed protein product [Sphacelaria rigidula]